MIDSVLTAAAPEGGPVKTRFPLMSAHVFTGTSAKTMGW